MFSFCLMFESGGTALRQDVGRGIGRSIGAKLGTVGGAVLGLGLASESPIFRLAPMVLGGIGNVIGRTAGGAIGKSIVSNPEKPADFSKMSHRYGYLNNTPKDFFGTPYDYDDYKRRFDKIGYHEDNDKLMLSPFMMSLSKPSNLKEKK